MKPKDYEVEIKSKNGRIHYFGMVVSCNSKSAACNFAWEQVHNMTPAEFKEWLINESKTPVIPLPQGQKIGRLADNFSYSARRFLG